MLTPPRCVAASFDGSRWECFAVGGMPDRHWAVLRNRGRTIESRLESGATEFLGGLDSYDSARAWAITLARADFALSACQDQRRTHVPLPVTLAPRWVGDTSGDPGGSAPSSGRPNSPTQIPAAAVDPTQQLWRSGRSSGVPVRSTNSAAKSRKRSTSARFDATPSDARMAPPEGRPIAAM